MSISSVAASSAVTAARASGQSSGASQTFAVTLGKFRTEHSRHEQQSAAASAGSATPTLAADTRALVGDVFGSLGGSSPSDADAERAVQAYGQTAAT